MVKDLGLKEPKTQKVEVEIEHRSSRNDTETSFDEEIEHHLRSSTVQEKSFEKICFEECILDWDEDENGLRSNFRPKMVELDQKGKIPINIFPSTRF